MSIKPINTEKDYENTLQRLDEIFHAPVGSIESDEADILVSLIEDYESKNYPIGVSDF